MPPFVAPAAVVLLFILACYLARRRRVAVEAAEAARAEAARAEAAAHTKALGQRGTAHKGPDAETADPEAAEQAAAEARRRVVVDALRAAGAELPRFAPAIAAGYPSEEAVLDYLMQRTGMRAQRDVDGVIFLGAYWFDRDHGLPVVACDHDAPLPEELVRHAAVCDLIAAQGLPAALAVTPGRVVWLTDQRADDGVTFAGAAVRVATDDVYNDCYLLFGYEPDAALSPDALEERETAEQATVEAEFAREAPARALARAAACAAAPPPPAEER